MYGGSKNVRRNLLLFFIDGITFMPTMTLICITTVIPFFLEQLNATTFQIALAASTALVCTIVTQPLFGSIASRVKSMQKTFTKILFLQRFIFFGFVLYIPLFTGNHQLLIWVFLVFWCIFNLFVGSYTVFFVPLLLKLLPPDKRGTLRGSGLAIGSLLGVGAAALIPVIINRIAFPYNFVVIFSIGCVFLLANATVFFLMREHEDEEPRVPMNILEYIKGIPSSVKDDKPFRAMVLMCSFLVVGHALRVFYTVYAIRVFDATEYHIALLAGLAVVANAIGYVTFGFIIDKYGPWINSVVSACLLVLAGAVALTVNTLEFLFVAWVVSSFANSAYGSVMSILIGEVTPAGKLPLYAGVMNIVSLALSSVVLLLLAPVLESAGFSLLFIVVILCGIFSLVTNFLLLRKYLYKKSA
ncbi:MAG: MFS transporter [Defluviitaleaceae bacterium]|nr:MFS transporter [Defluviitaleaceae bacterium]